MKKFQEQLTWVSKTLGGLSRQVDKLARQIAKKSAVSAPKGKRGRASARKAPAARAAAKGRDTVLDTVYTTIQRSRKGITIPQLRSKTGLGARQLSNALYKLTKKGHVHTVSRGVYMKK
jgi:hypothetical protein